MKVYKLRFRGGEDFIKKSNSYGVKTSVDRIYSEKRLAATAASHFASSFWIAENTYRDDKGRKQLDKSWWELPKQERLAYRESIIEIVEYDCVEVKNEVLPA